MKTYISYLLPVVIAVPAILLYANTFTHEFVNFDDPDLVIQNTTIRSLSVQNLKAIFTPGEVGAFQPVRTLSYAFDYHFWQLDPAGYHLTNVVCHAINTLLVYAIVFTLSQQILMASLASLLFAVHPVHVEAVAWIAGRRDVLATAFGLLSFFFLLKCFPPRRETSKQEEPPARRMCIFWYLLTLGCFALGLLTKPSIVILPLLFLLYDVCFLRPPIMTAWRRGLAYLPFFLGSLIFFLVFLKVSRSSGVVEQSYHAQDAFGRLLTMIQVFGEYILMLFVPRHLSVTYGITPVESLGNPSFLLALGVLSLVVMLTVIAWKTSRTVFFAIAWLFISLLPVSNIIPIAITKADRYLYLPSAGFCLAAAWLAMRGRRFIAEGTASNKRLLEMGYWLMIGVVLLSYGIQTVQRNRDWKDSHTLWTATLETHPDSPIALNNLGLIYAEQGLYDKAIALYQRLLSFHPNQEHVERVYANMGDAYAGMQQYDEAITHYQQALTVEPEYTPAYLGLGRASMALGQYGEAERIYGLARDIDGQNDAVHTHLGNLYAMQGKYDQAIKKFEHALRLNPLSVNAANGLGLSYGRKGNTAKALEIYQRALRQHPDSSLIQNSLGSVYMHMGQPEQAIAQFTASLEREPENVEVRNNLAILYLRAERYEEAARQLMTSLQYDRSNPKIISNLGNTYVHLGLYEQAVQMYQWAIELDPSLLQPHLYLGELCLGMGDMECAIEAYQGALKLQPDNQKIRQQLETARQKQQDHAQ